jgi:hypothetical protein
MLRKIVFMVLIPLGVLAAPETDVSGSDLESPHSTPVASRRVSKELQPQSPGERREKAVRAAISRLKVQDAESFIERFSLIPDPLFERFTGAINLFAANLRIITKRRYEGALESLVEGLGLIFLRFQERPGILKAIVDESAGEFSEKLQLKRTEPPLSKRMSRALKEMVLSRDFFPKLFEGVAGSVLERIQTGSGMTSENLLKNFVNAYKEEDREDVLAIFQTVREEDRDFYAYMTAVTANPDPELLKLLKGSSHRSRLWICRMVKSYSSDRMPLNSLKMAKYFLGVPELHQESVRRVLETFFDKEFEEREDSQARIVNLFMKRPISPEIYISHFVNIIGFLERRFNGELAEFFLQQLTSSGWGYVETEIRKLKEKDWPFELTRDLLSKLFQEGLQEAARVTAV